MISHGTIRTIAKASGLRRRHIAAVRMCCERSVIASLPGLPQEPRSRILCYHSVGTPSWGVNDVSPTRFRRQLETALREGYRFVPADELASDATGDAKRLAITFDDGLRTVATNAAPILKEYGIPWTIFIVSDWADGRHDFGEDIMLGWSEIARLATAGATIASHSVTHPNFASLDAAAAATELRGSRQTIGQRIGLDTTGFAIPFGQSKNWTAVAGKAALDAGYKTVYAQSERRRAPGTVARTFVTRFDGDRIFHASLRGAFDRWEEWL